MNQILNAMKTLFTVLVLFSSIILFKATETFFELQPIGAINGQLSATLFKQPISDSEQNMVFSLNIDKQKNPLILIDSLLNILIQEALKIIVFTLVLGFGISGISLFMSQKDSFEIF